MDTYLAVASKRDWRSYADRPVAEETQRRILDAGRLAGSSQNRQPWIFVAVESPASKARLAETVPAELAVTRASTGTVFELGFRVRLHGPCYRCLEDAVLELPIAVCEYEATSPGGSDELRTPYLEDDRLDLSAWARDALALELPDKILCRPDCAGLCPVCGRDLNREPHDHDEAEPDTRWSALAELRNRL